MPDFILLTHDDAVAVADVSAWEPYIRRLRAAGIFEGGSAIGDGVCVRKNGAPAPIGTHLIGFIRISADNLDHAKALLPGHPIFEAGGTVEIRELPRTD